MRSNLNCGRCSLVWIGVLLMAGPAGSQEAPRRAVLHVRLPADAKLTVDGRSTRQTGTLRHFFSPPLEMAKSYHYTFEWTFRKGGKTYKATKVINVRAGDDREEDLTREKGMAVDAEEKKPDKDADEKLDVKFVATPPKVVDKMLELANIEEDDVVYDLGCGDGRIVVAAAKKYQCKAVGYDLDDKRVREAKAKVMAAGLEDQVTIEKKNLFDVNLKPASVVMLYLQPDVNAKLIPQLEKLKAGSRIVSHNFKIKSYPPKRSEVVTVDGVKHDVYLWEAPLVKE